MKLETNLLTAITTGIIIGLVVGSSLGIVVVLWSKACNSSNIISCAGAEPKSTGATVTCTTKKMKQTIEVGASVVLGGHLNNATVLGALAKTHPSKPFVLHNSLGGHVFAATELSRSGRVIKITGDHCFSACAMVLIQSKHACVAETVKEITFHTITTPQCDGSRVVEKTKMENFIREVRLPLREEIQHLANREAFYTVTLDAFLAVYPEKRCEQSAYAVNPRLDWSPFAEFAVKR